MKRAFESARDGCESSHSCSVGRNHEWLRGFAVEDVCREGVGEMGPTTWPEGGMLGVGSDGPKRRRGEVELEEGAGSEIGVSARHGEGFHDASKLSEGGRGCEVEPVRIRGSHVEEIFVGSQRSDVSC